MSTEPATQRPAPPSSAPSDLTACEACGARAAGPVIFVVQGYPIRRCSTCGLLAAEVSGFDADRIYTEGYFQGGAPDGYFDYLGSERLAGAEYEARLALLLQHVEGGRLLEVGCATGGFLAFARSRFEVQGVDVSAFAVEQARGKGLDVRQGDVESAPDLTAPFDAAALFDTIEHLPAPRAALLRVAELLRPGGVVALSTGDAGSLLARASGRRWRLMTPPQHLWFFTQRSMEALLAQAGLNVVSISHAWRRVPVSLMWYQLFRGTARPLPPWIGRALVPVNLFDTMTVIARRPLG
jgi:SAM-dependent methyltransferase